MRTGHYIYFTSLIAEYNWLE